MTQPLDVGLDMDGIIVALHQHWLQAIEREHGVKTYLEEITQWSMHKCGGLVELGAKKVYGFLDKPGFFRDAPPIQGAIEAVKDLFDATNAEGEKMFNLFIVSSPAGAQSAMEKYDWLAHYLPFLKPENICLFPQKTLIKMDILVDDRGETVVEYRKAWPDALVTGIQYPYNQGTAGLYGDHRNTYGAWMDIVDACHRRYYEVKGRREAIAAAGLD